MYRLSARQARPVPAKITLGLAAVLATLWSGGALAGTATSNFQTTITIQASCTIVSISPSTMDFGTQGVLAANVNQQLDITVQCTNTTPYNIGLDAGTGTGATVGVRKLTNGGSTINYSLYTDAGRATVWGNTVGTDTVAATGNGAAQSYSVYGRIPAQTTPAPATYTDTITVTVTY